MIQGDLSFANPIGIGEAPTLILAVFSEFIAPIFIIVGYKTKFFSFFTAATMFVAAFVVHWGDPFGRIEKALLFLTVFVILMMTGPGKCSKLNQIDFLNESKKYTINIHVVNFINNIFTVNSCEWNCC